MKVLVSRPKILQAKQLRLLVLSYGGGRRVVGCVKASDPGPTGDCGEASLQYKALGFYHLTHSIMWTMTIIEAYNLTNREVTNLGSTAVLKYPNQKPIGKWWRGLNPI